MASISTLDTSVAKKQFSPLLSPNKHPIFKTGNRPRCEIHQVFQKHCTLLALYTVMCMALDKSCSHCVSYNLAFKNDSALLL